MFTSERTFLSSHPFMVFITINMKNLWCHVKFLAGGEIMSEDEIEKQKRKFNKREKLAVKIFFIENKVAVQNKRKQTRQFNPSIHIFNSSVICSMHTIEPS